jgi:hypothetical protein
MMFLCVLVLGVASQPAYGLFDPPRILVALKTVDGGDLPDSLAQKREYYISKGFESSINRGDVLNVYREKRLSSELNLTVRLYIGTMTIIDSQNGSSLGRFSANSYAISHPRIKYKTALKNDLVVPRLIIDSSVLFDPGKADLKPGVAEEFDKVAEFVKNFAPSKLVLEGHTDADGERESNQKLSEKRAKMVRQYLIDTYEFIKPSMIEAKGYGEERPLVDNTTKENKTLNRRIEVIVWE